MVTQKVQTARFEFHSPFMVGVGCQEMYFGGEKPKISTCIRWTRKMYKRQEPSEIKSVLLWIPDIEQLARNTRGHIVPPEILVGIDKKKGIR
jgi:hypothetical protein